MGTRLILLAVLALALPKLADAQSGTIKYTRAITLDVEVPQQMTDVKELFAEAGRRTFLLRFTPSSSLMVPASGDGGRESPYVVFPLTNQNFNALVGLIESKTLNEDLLLQQAYLSSDGASAVRILQTSQRLLRLDTVPPAIEWQLADDHGEHVGYDEVTKATAQVDGAYVEAWFAPQIAVRGGPALYGGLPGMILVLSLNDGRTNYVATEISLDGVEEGVVRPPDQGQVVSHGEYESIVSDEVDGLGRAIRKMRLNFGGPVECSAKTQGARVVLSCWEG